MREGSARFCPGSWFRGPTPGSAPARQREPALSLPKGRLSPHEDFLEVFDKRIRDISPEVVRDARGVSFHVFHQSVQIVARAGNAYHTNGGAVPKAAGIEFSDRNVETGAQTVFEAADDPPFVLERLRRFDMEFEGEKCDGHQFSVPSCRFSVNATFCNN